MTQLVSIDENQSQAVEARMELDLRIGAAFTRFQTLRLGKKFTVLADHVISYGSCQFPTLGFVVDQYWRVNNFVPENFWKLEMSVARDGLVARFEWDRVRIFDQLICLVVYEKCLERAQARVTRFTSKPTEKWCVRRHEHFLI